MKSRVSQNVFCFLYFMSFKQLVLNRAAQLGGVAFRFQRQIENSPLGHTVHQARDRFSHNISKVAPGVATRFHGILGEAHKGLSKTTLYRKSLVNSFDGIQAHPHHEKLIDIITAPNSKDKDGFPIITPESFKLFRDKVPHLFVNGLAVLEWIDDVSLQVGENKKQDPVAYASIENGLNALRTLVRTPATTAPPALWLARQILATHKRLGTLDALIKAGDKGLNVEIFARESALEPKQMVIDLDFLHQLGYLDKKSNGNYSVANFDVVALFEAIQDIPAHLRFDHATVLQKFFEGSATETEKGLLEDWFRLPQMDSPAISLWRGSVADMELSYYLLPLVIALKATGNYKKIINDLFDESYSSIPFKILMNAGFIDEGGLTSLGEKVFDQGVGAYGIVGAYHTYLEGDKHEDLLRNPNASKHVNRGPNVVASEIGNRKTFSTAAKSIAKYEKDRGRKFDVVIEHAAGGSVGIEEYIKASGSEGRIFVAADLEDDALKLTRKKIKEGKLPDSIVQVQPADIGRAEQLLNVLKAKGIDTKNAVMIVGNGFHEARGKTDAEMVALKKAYREAGITLVYTEEIRLTSDQIRETGFNTYHAPFLWAHDTSGQVLRMIVPANSRKSGERMSWQASDTLAGFKLLAPYMNRTRRIMPVADENDASNPSISVTFFAVP